MQQTKFSRILLFTSALLIAGLFFYLRQPSKIAFSEMNPDQLNFSKSNRILESKQDSIQLTKTIESNSSSEMQKTSAAIQSLHGLDAKVWQVFESVLASKNDNDPRLDQDLKYLSKDLRQALFEKYNSLPSENRNDRGLIVFLISRDIQSAADATFLKSVFEEPPCLSLSDCKTIGQDDAHHSGMNQTTLNYPQLAGLYQIEKQLTAHPEILKDAVQRDGILKTLQQAENFPVPAVQRKAEQIRLKFGL
ncbi:MAG: hypothetical protein WA160_05050 [Pseudobdellovibrio sp.]